MIDLNQYLQDETKVLLRSGVYGTVYKWTNNISQQVFAVKEINRSSITNQKQLNNLINEISILQQIKSTNTVQMFEFKQTTGDIVFYLFMEFCDGGDLEQLLKKEKQLSEDKVKKFIADFLNGYLQLFINYVIHRDLKPANIVIHQNAFKIADFGLSRYLENSLDQMLFSAEVGTPYYSSLQIIKEQEYTTKSDVWSFGIILYQCLYGELPFAQKGKEEMFKFYELLQNKQFEYPDTPVVSQQLMDIISKCLVVDEDNRISWQELMKDPYILEFFQEFVKLEKEIQQQEQIIIQNIHKQYQNNNILDIDSIFQQFGTNGEQKLNMEQFSSLIKQINPLLIKFYIEYIYNNIVKEKNQEIGKESLEAWLKPFKVLGDYFYFNNNASLINQKWYQAKTIMIFKGRRKVSNEEVAIKIIPNALISEKKVDIEFMKRLKSPNLVKVLDVKENLDETYLIQEYFDGASLEKLLLSEKQLSEQEVQELLAGLLDALFEFHSNDIGHRQLEPSHILLKQKQVKLINNFIHVRKVKNSQDMLSTINCDFKYKYLSPQLRKEEPYNVFKNDIYALGIILLDCVWKENPSQQNALIDNYSQIQFPKQIPISKELQEIILQCIEQDEATRISLQDLLRDPYIIQFYDKYLPIEKAIKQKENEIIQIIKNNHSLDDLFAEQNETQSQGIDLNQFSATIRQIYQQELANFEIEYIFDKINSQKQQTIKKEQLKIWINSQQQIQQNLQNDQRKQQFKEIPAAISTLLIPAMKQYKTDVQLLFDVFEDKNDKIPLGYMMYEGFREIITNVKKSTDDSLIKDAFHYFVKNQENKIIEKDFIQIINGLI